MIGRRAGEGRFLGEATPDSNTGRSLPVRGQQARDWKTGWEPGLLCFVSQSEEFQFYSKCNKMSSKGDP